MSTPRVVVDARMVGPQGHGIGNYVSDLAIAFEGKRFGFELAFLVSPATPADSPVRKFEHRESKIPFLHPKEALLLRRDIQALRPRLFHSPSFMSILNYPCPHAITVHDLNHLRFGGLFHKIYYHHLLLPALKTARGIATVSQTAAEELGDWMKQHHLVREISVVPNSIHPRAGTSSRETLRTYGLEENGYFFCLANAKAHKNLALLKAAYREARRTAPDLPPLVLSVAGHDGENIRHLGSLPAAALPALLKNARAFYFPSLYEGFGRPPVEAALEGTLPIVSDLPVLKEALAGVWETRFVPATDRAAWAQAFLDFRRGAKPRLELRSLEWILDTYSLERVAKEMRYFYQRCLEAAP